MTRQEATAFVTPLTHDGRLVWWKFYTKRLDQSPHFKVVGRHRVTGSTVDLYDVDMHEAVRLTGGPAEPNTTVEVCAWLGNFVRQLETRIGNQRADMDRLGADIAEIQQRLGIEDTPF